MNDTKHEKRYVITLDLFMYAENDEVMKDKTEKLLKKINDLNEEYEASIKEMEEVVFGQFGETRKIETS